MASENSPGPDEEIAEAIMRATYRALCIHGYADLTMGAIAEEFEKSQAVLHYHYGTKQDLLIAFLDYLLDRFQAEIQTDTDATATPRDRLDGFVDVLLFGPEDRRVDEEFDHWTFHTALLEVRAQAPHNEAFREQFTLSFETAEEMAAELIRLGIEQGAFRAVDPDATADFLLSAINGARVYQVTTERDDIAETVHGQLREYVAETLVRPEAE